MAVIIKTTNPSGLLASIKKSIDTKKIETWSYDSDGYFTHTPEQWKFKAWFKAKEYQGELRFGIFAPKDTNMSKMIYGLYHGRFIEMLLIHFDTDFSDVMATAQQTEPDYFIIRQK